MSKLSAGFSKTDYPLGADRLMSVRGGTTQMSVPQDNSFNYPRKLRKPKQPPRKNNAQYNLQNNCNLQSNQDTLPGSRLCPPNSRIMTWTSEHGFKTLKCLVFTFYQERHFIIIIIKGDVIITYPCILCLIDM